MQSPITIERHNENERLWQQLISAMRQDGTSFLDHDVHRALVKMGCPHIEGEWYRCTPQQVKAAVVAVRERVDVAWHRDKTFSLRPEQERADEWAREFNWDCIVLDEYHYGAWRENAKELIGATSDYKSEETDLRSEIENPDYFDEDLIPITSNHYLYLSGTPFRAIASGEFIEEQIYNWTYSDEQRAKEEWGDKPNNPYASLPKMVLLTYQLPAEISRVAEEGEFDEFDLNSFFEAEGKGEDAVFKNHDEVQKWLDMLRGQYLPTSINDLKAGNRKPPLPFLNGDLYSNMNHTLWFLPNVASCFAMRNLLTELQNTFYHDYRVIVCAGTKAGIGQQALPPVERAMSHPDPLHCKTITLTCGKLTTGVTVRPWTGIFMLRRRL